MTYTVSSGTLNSTMPYNTKTKTTDTKTTSAEVGYWRRLRCQPGDSSDAMACPATTVCLWVRGRP